MKKIEVSNLKRLFQMVIEKLQDFEGIDKIEINEDEDMYQFISTDEWQLSEPKPLVGSLYDDLEELEKIIIDSERVITFVDFDRISSILHFISEKMNPTNG